MRMDEAQAALSRMVVGTVAGAVPDASTAARLWQERDVVWRRTFLSSIVREVVVSPVPKGDPTRPAPDWHGRTQQLARRVEIRWRLLTLPGSKTRYIVRTSRRVSLLHRRPRASGTP